MSVAAVFASPSSSSNVPTTEAVEDSLPQLTSLDSILEIEGIPFKLN